MIKGFFFAIISTASARVFTGTISTSGMRAASMAFSSGTITRLYHRARANITVGKTPCTGRTIPSSANSPMMRVSARISLSNQQDSPKIPRAIGRSKLGPDFGTSAGARLMVIFVRGKGN